jgi:hypothetical protein
MSTNTRLSLYKLFLSSTIWGKLTHTERRRILYWLELHKSNTSRRNAADNLYETFVWFPTTEEGDVWVPLGHLTRLLDHIDARTPSNAATHPNLTLRRSLRRTLETCTGPYILGLRVAALNEQAAQ